ncbi:cation transporter [Sphingomonas koreensis]|uniref:Cation transporter n=1 Tax=Sphingomonas koreensis TaxID=93064 RepID=A0A1L6J9R1_9SPHN|nr:cation diffusion facilitator family transporter [Sphingomonas koreensis]APR52668.1 cation transporter [Sphingomonas koreensis]MDC7812496.1 cation diffusion facilitator family transporter [Sphingomonas koreensis]RSU18335.1 cation transporter [Sphingomonas koreensis]RSU28506.1 cation transporter [Sphingomonas koreensis]RSU31173.1 cation transporter [Sphingomonas koreensis]
MHGSHNHSGHSHAGHSHAPADFGRAFAIGTALNLAFVLVEGMAGIVTGSMALLADAGHNLSDVLGLLIAWGGAELAKRPASRRFTYGLSSSTILAALANAVLLLFAVGAIALEAVQRFQDPPPVAGLTVMIVAGIGILINGATAFMFMRGRAGDINIRGAYLHMVADAAVSAGVVLGGGLILLTNASWIDPAISLVIVAVILWSTWGLLRDSVTMALHAVPAGIDPEKVEDMLATLPGVTRVHDLHIWPMSTTESALTAHLLIPGGHPGDAFLDDAQHRLEHDFGIGHATLQIEVGDGDPCRLHNGHGHKQGHGNHQHDDHDHDGHSHG